MSQELTDGSTAWGTDESPGRANQRRSGQSPEEDSAKGTESVARGVKRELEVWSHGSMEGKSKNQVSLALRTSPVSSMGVSRQDMGGWVHLGLRCCPVNIAEGREGKGIGGSCIGVIISMDKEGAKHEEAEGPEESVRLSGFSSH